MVSARVCPELLPWPCGNWRIFFSPGPACSAPGWLLYSSLCPMSVQPAPQTPLSEYLLRTYACYTMVSPTPTGPRFQPGFAAGGVPSVQRRGTVLHRERGERPSRGSLVQPPRRRGDASCSSVFFFRGGEFHYFVSLCCVRPLASRNDTNQV